MLSQAHANASVNLVMKAQFYAQPVVFALTNPCGVMV